MFNSKMVADATLASQALLFVNYLLLIFPAFDHL